MEYIILLGSLLILFQISPYRLILAVTTVMRFLHNTKLKAIFFLFTVYKGAGTAFFFKRETSFISSCASIFSGTPGILIS